MGDSGDGIDLMGEGGPLESVTGVAGPVLLAATVPDLARGDVLAGRYQIEAVIGTGGSGRVLRAFDRVTRTAVALKILRPEYAADPVWNERFSRELRVGRQIQHPNVCRVYDIGDSDGHKFLSMELATGGTVRSQLVPGAPPRSVDDRIADARAIIQGVAALHAAGIVHRDLKPENILRAADGRLLVSDFGLATDPGAGPATTIMIGTPRYMAPEVVMGDPATVRSDVWALGVVMHEILSGERPNRSIIKRRRRTYTPPEVGSPRERRLVELCARCSEEDPEDRPASAVELRREFEAAASGRRVGGRAVRKQVAWAAVAAVALATLGLVRNRWTSNAVASSSNAAAFADNRTLLPTGPIADWGKPTTRLVSFPGAIDCFSLIDSGRRARVVWGTPPKAVDVDIRTGQTAPAAVRPETFSSGCPQLSPDGRRLLFEKADATGGNILLSPFPDGREAKQVVRGGSPVWFPNSEEFGFALDARHAGMFSIPTGQMTIVADQVAGGRQITGIAVAPDATHLALRYFSDTYHSIIRVVSLPSLDVVGTFSTPPALAALQFAPNGSEVLFAVDGDKGNARFVGLNWRTKAFHNLGAVSGMDVRATLASQHGPVVLARALKSDLWVQTAHGNARVTSDGESDSGSVSILDDVLVQQHQQDGQYRLALREKGKETRIVSSGPTDGGPAFFPDGQEWVYASMNTREIRRCRKSDLSCTVAVSDALTPGWPVVAPSGTRLAYVTMMNQHRVRLLDLGRGPAVGKDLGPASADCPPFWASETSLWIRGADGSDNLWEEIDVRAGRRSGRREPVAVVPGDSPNLRCRIPQAVLRASLDGRYVSVATEEESVLFHRPAPPN